MGWDRWSAGLVCCIGMGAVPALGAPGDLDDDGVADTRDNCVLDFNPSQLDSSDLSGLQDGFGDACDADYDHSGEVTVADFAAFLTYFGGVGPAEVNHRGDGTITVEDFALFLHQFGGPPGPSAGEDADLDGFVDEFCAVTSSPQIEACPAFVSWVTARPYFVSLGVRPVYGQPVGAERRWEICLEDTSAAFMHRISFGLRVPGMGADGLLVEGCEPAVPGAFDDCASDSVDMRFLGYGPDFDEVVEANSFTYGPLDASETVGTALAVDTRYLVLEGEESGLSPINPFLSRGICFTTLTVPSEFAGVPPEIVIDGVDDLPFTAGPWFGQVTRDERLEFDFP